MIMVVKECISPQINCMLNFKLFKLAPIRNMAWEFVVYSLSCVGA